MSDFSQGPGWWQASDGRWYPPELHPDAAPGAPSPPSGAYGVPAGPANGPWGAQAQPGGYGVPNQGAAVPGPPQPGQKKSNKGLWIALAAVVAIPVIGVWGCIALVRQGTEAAVTGAADAVGNAVDEELNSNDATSEEGGEAGTEADPLPVGTEADLGNGWRIKVNSANLDATADVVAADEFNQDPSEGMRFVVVDLTLSFDGDGGEQRDSPMFGAHLSLWGSDRVERSTGVIGVSLENEIDLMSDIAAGSAATGTAVFEVGAEETDLVMLAEPTMSFDQTEAWFALE